TDLRHHLRTEMTLISPVMHRKHDRNPVKPALSVPPGPQIHRGERGVPVVRMQQYWSLRDAGQGRNCGGRARGVALVIVRVVAPFVAVESGASEIPLVFNEPHGSF